MGFTIVFGTTGLALVSELNASCETRKNAADSYEDIRDKYNGTISQTPKTEVRTASESRCDYIITEKLPHTLLYCITVMTTHRWCVACKPTNPSLNIVSCTFHSIGLIITINSMNQR